MVVNARPENLIHLNYILNLREKGIWAPKKSNANQARFIHIFKAPYPKIVILTQSNKVIQLFAAAGINISIDGLK